MASTAANMMSRTLRRADDPSLFGGSVELAGSVVPAPLAIDLENN